MTELIPEKLWNDYCQTRVLFDLNAQHYRLLPSESGDNAWPWTNDITDVFILSAIHPRSRQSTDQEIVRLNQHMANSLDELSLNFIRCIGKPERDDWPEEESFLITNATESTIIKLCQDFDQNAYFHWTKDFWSVKGIFAPQTCFINWTLEVTL